MQRTTLLVSLLVIQSLAVTSVNASEAYSKPADHKFPSRVYWGDTHLHTRNSADAYGFGNTNLTPIDAYRFARGQELIVKNGKRVRLNRPLDFLVVADHAEYLAGRYRFDAGDPIVTDTPTGEQWRGYLENQDFLAMAMAFVNSMRDPVKNVPFPADTRNRIWLDVTLTADEYNQPGVFTAFSGYEWTSMINGNNLHRVVLFKDDADKVSKMTPFSAQDSLDPRDLWNALDEYHNTTGGDVMAIAHNGNISNGMMFPDRSVDGNPIDLGYAELRARWEPLYEVTQVKGDGESHPTLSPDDEFADYENWDKDNIARTQKKEDWMLKHEYARSALKLGLKYEQSLGVNPYKIGLIGSTDGHNSVSTTEEDNFFGKFPESLPGPDRMTNAMANDQLWKNWRLVSSGYAAVWAEENTRESLFAAMKRREVYATTGSRISVRLFGGWEYTDADIQSPAYVRLGYQKGVPMGGDLTMAPKEQPITFMLAASKDPAGANLDRAQIIKGWLDSTGELQEKVYDVAWSDDRAQDKRTGKVPPVGNTVDLDTATFTNTIGAAELTVVWTDPDFDPAERAFYYARVIEAGPLMMLCTSMWSCQMKHPAPFRTGLIHPRFGIRHSPLETTIQRTSVLLSAHRRPAIFLKQNDVASEQHHYGQ